MATGANTTPLGRLNPAFATGNKSSGSSLLKPSYMQGALGGGGNSSSSCSTTSSSTSSAFAQSVAAAAAAAMALAAQQPPPPPQRSVHSASPRSMSMSVGVANAHFIASLHAPPPPPPPPPPPSPPITLQSPVVKREYEHENNTVDSDGDRKRRRRSRWASDDKDKAFIPGMPPVLPNNLSKSQEKAYLLQLQIEELSRRLRMGDLGIPPNPEDRSPSPEPIYNNEGKRLNTREYRTRKKLEDERHHLIQQMFNVNPEFKPPSDYKPPIVRVNDKVMIPQEEHPDINFVGLLIGPRGNTLKSMEKDTGAKIIIRGKGSVKEGKVSRKDGQLLPGEDEPLHAYVTANNPESVKKAVERIKEIIRQGVEVPEGQNDLRRMQLRELALLNGTLRENEGQRCSNCGASNHKSWQCPDKPNVTNNVICSSCGGVGHIAKDCRERRLGGGGGGGFAATTGVAEKSKIDEEYMSLMAELGEGPPPPLKSSSGGMHGHSSSLFSNNQGAPRALMAPPPSVHGQAPPPALMSQSVQPPWNQGQVPPPPGILAQPPPPPPPPGSQATSPTAMSWMQQQSAAMGWQQQPTPVPPPRAGTMSSVSHWAQGFVGVAPPPPPPPPPSQVGQSGVDLNTLAQVGLPNLLAAPPPPPPPPS